MKTYISIQEHPREEKKMRPAMKDHGAETAGRRLFEHFWLSFPQVQRVGNPSSERFRTSRNDRTSELRQHYALRASLFFPVVVALTIFVSAGMHADAATGPKGFSTPEEAVKTVITAARNNDDKELIAIFGASAKDLIFSGDAVADKERRASFLKAYDEKNSLVSQDGGMVLVIGNKDWPFPIPLVKKGKMWSFDTARGREEILNRRIGENELSTIQTLLAVVDAQREYAVNDHDGDGTIEYAEKFRSDPGKKNGLYWPTKDGEEPSPLGQLVADARAKGYGQAASKQKPVPYNGYYFRMLKAQGKNAPGGAYDYVVKGKMIGGFAVVAYPAKYGNSGVMTFIVSYDGTVFQKNLGKNTASIAKAMKIYDPGSGWKKVDTGSEQ